MLGKPPAKQGCLICVARTAPGSLKKQQGNPSLRIPHPDLGMSKFGHPKHALCVVCLFLPLRPSEKASPPPPTRPCASPRRPSPDARAQLGELAVPLPLQRLALRGAGVDAGLAIELRGAWVGVVWWEA